MNAKEKKKLSHTRYPFQEELKKQLGNHQTVLCSVAIFPAYLPKKWMVKDTVTCIGKKNNNKCNRKK